MVEAWGQGGDRNKQTMLNTDSGASAQAPTRHTSSHLQSAQCPPKAYKCLKLLLGRNAPLGLCQSTPLGLLRLLSQTQ